MELSGAHAPGALPPGHREWPDLGAVDPDALSTVSLVLRPRGDPVVPDLTELGRLGPRARSQVARSQLPVLRGSAPGDRGVVRRWVDRAGLELEAESVGWRWARVRGPLGRLQELFQVELRRSSQGDREFRFARGVPVVPAGLEDQVVAVLGLSRAPVARTHFRPLPLPKPVRSLSQAAPLSFLPPQVAQLYSFPEGTSGEGGCLGLIELGGGYREADLTAYFEGLGIAAPEVVAVPVLGAANRPTGDPEGPDGEVMLDIEVAGSAAPGLRIAVYFTPNTDEGFLAAVQAAIHDETNQPSVVSISWGGPEEGWPSATMTAFDQAFQDAGLSGTTICVAAGDQGSGDGVADGEAHVDFPASSPHALGCGGTRLTAKGEAIASEVTWNDGKGEGATGGGVSAVFPLPDWQAGAGVPPSADPGHPTGRGVPDVAADADPETGYQLRVDGEQVVFGGTSAVAPLWAALLLRCGDQLGHGLGYLNPILYESYQKDGVTHDITQGSNGAYRAGRGWDPCTGWGSPDGARLLSALKG